MCDGSERIGELIEALATGKRSWRSIGGNKYFKRELRRKVEEWTISQITRAQGEL